MAAGGVPVVIRYTIGISLLNISIMMMLDRYMRMPGSTATGRILNAAPIVWMGTISYSMYLWQQPWMFTTEPIPLRVVGAVTCAALSYYLVEQPMLRLRKRLQKKSQERVPVPAIS